MLTIRQLSSLTYQPTLWDICYLLHAYSLLDAYKSLILFRSFPLQLKNL